MNYEKILISLCVCLAISAIAEPPIIVKKVVDLVGLTALLRNQGYKILSLEKETFEAQKELPLQKKIVNGHPVVSQRIDSCKITKLGEDFFVEAAKTTRKEMLDDYQKGTIFSEEGFELKEESCDCHKKTAYVFTLDQAIDIIVSFLTRKN